MKLNTELLSSNPFLRECLDHIRWIAAFAVVIGHNRNQSWTAFDNAGDLPLAIEAFYFVSNFHFEAVIVFFCLSGLLVGGRGLADIQRGRLSIRRYAADRISRIALPFYGAVLVTVAVSAYLSASPEGPVCRPAPSLVDIAGHLVFVQNVAVDVFCNNVALWSLTNETWYYIGFGLVAAWLISRRPWTLAALLAVAAAFAWFDAYDKTNVVIYAAMWCAGILVWLAPRRPVPLVFGVAAAVVPLVVSRLHVIDDLFWLRDGAIAFGMVVLLRALADFGSGRSPRASGAFFPGSSAVGHALAGFSFSLYLIHMPVFWLGYHVAQAHFGIVFPLVPGDPAAWIFLASTTGAGIAAAVVLWSATERQTGAVRRLLYGRFGVDAPVR